MKSTPLPTTSRPVDCRSLVLPSRSMQVSNKIAQ
jgi:hypothetical protein